MTTKKEATPSKNIFVRRPHQVPVRLTREERELMRDICHELDMKMSALIREAIMDLLVKYKKITRTQADRMLSYERQKPVTPGVRPVA